MIGNEERKAVAKLLRDGSIFMTMDCRSCNMLTEIVYGRAGAICGDAVVLGVCTGNCSMLADLIDRPTCRIIHDERRDCEVCTNCSTAFEIAEFDYADAMVFEKYSYCPKCGAEVVE